VAPLKIRVNCVAPGLIETEGWKVYFAGSARHLSAIEPDDACRSAWDIAEPAAISPGRPADL